MAAAWLPMAMPKARRTLGEKEFSFILTAEMKRMVVVKLELGTEAYVYVLCYQRQRRKMERWLKREEMGDDLPDICSSRAWSRNGGAHNLSLDL